MIENRPQQRLLLIAVGLVLGLGARTARAQDDEELVEEDAPAALAVPADPNAFVLNEAQFNAWVFGNAAQLSGGMPAKLTALLGVQIAEMDRVCDLSDKQEKKLRLAGRGDIKRFFDRVEEKRRKFQGKSYDRNKIGEIYQEIQPLQASMNAGLFEGDALFAKIAERVLNEQQRQRYEGELRTRRTYQYKTQVALTINRLARSVGISAERQIKLQTLILRETRVPRRLGSNNVSYYVVLLEISRIPEQKLRPLFTEAQWPLIQIVLQQGQGMEPSLKTSGYLPAEEGDASAAEPVAGSPKSGAEE